MLAALFLTVALSIGQQASLYKSLATYDAHVAYFQLFPQTAEGKKALATAWRMIGARAPLPAPPSLLNIDSLTHNFPNRHLKGYYATTIEELLALPPEEISISRALLIEDETKRQSYEAELDLMALKVLAKLQRKGGLLAKPEDKIEAINQLIFFDMAMRYPPLSLSEEHIDSYSSLAAVLESKRGVCLGTSVVYLAVAERIGLPLEIVTPPGHIYVRGYDSLGRRINIETTARGVDVSDRHYQSINVKSLKTRDRKETIGLLFVNEASIYMREQNFEKALRCYEKAEIFVKDDPVITQLRGICLALTGQEKAAKACLTHSLSLREETQIDQLTLAEDFLAHRVDQETIKIFFTETKSTRPELLDKQRRLEEALSRFPAFREGLLELADIYLKLNRPKEAIITLKRYHALNPNSLQVEFMLGILSMSRVEYPEAYRHLTNVKKLLTMHGQKSREFDSAWQQLCFYYTPSNLF